MRRFETAAITALMLLSHTLSPAIAEQASPLVIAQAETKAPPAAAPTPAPAQPPAATTAPTTVVIVAAA